VEPERDVRRVEDVKVPGAEEGDRDPLEVQHLLVDMERWADDLASQCEDQRPRGAKQGPLEAFFELAQDVGRKRYPDLLPVADRQGSGARLEIELRPKHRIGRRQFVGGANVALVDKVDVVLADRVDEHFPYVNHIVGENYSRPNTSSLQLKRKPMLFSCDITESDTRHFS
jgi:hypothetical protein